MSKFYAKISKVDPDQRIVEGYASTEALDSQGERVSRAAIDAALADYMKFANVREMHQPSAVGKTVWASMDDKGLKISVKVVDDVAWKKVKEEVYQGFSIGGTATKKVDNTIEELKLTEISLVDRPACPEALITLWKADGAKPMNKTKDDVQKAVEAIAMANLQKACGLSNIAQLAHTVESLVWVTYDAEWEKQYEGDNSQVPALLKDAYKILCQALKDMTEEETAEQLKALDELSAKTEAMTAVVPTEVALAAKSEVTKADEEPAKEEEEAPPAAPAPAKEEEAPKEAPKEEAPVAAEEPAKEEEKVQRQYSDEDKLALKAVYQMMKESGILEELKAAETSAEAPKEEAPAAAPVEGEPAKEEEVAAKSEGADEEAPKEEVPAAPAKEEEAPEEEEEEDEDEETEKFAKALGLSKFDKGDMSLLKSAGLTSSASIVKALNDAGEALKKRDDIIEQLKKMAAPTQGHLRIVGRDGDAVEVTPAQLLEKGESSTEVLAKILSGELNTGNPQRYG